MANGYYNSALEQPPKKKFDFQGLLQGLLQGAAGATQARNPWQGALLGGAGAIDYMNQDAMRQAYIQNLIEDNLRNNQLLDLQKQRYGQDIKEYEEIDKPYKQGIINTMSEKVSPRQQRYNDEMARLKLAQEKNQNVILRNKARGLTTADGEYRKPYYTDFKEYILPNGQVIKEQTDVSRGTTTYLNKMTNENLTRLPEDAKEKAKVNPTLPATQAEILGNLDSFQKDINELRTKFNSEDNKGAYTGVQGMYGAVGQYLPSGYGGIGQKNREFRAVHNRLYKNMFAEGGKNLTTYEQKILKPLFPSLNMPDEQYEISLDNLEKTYNNLKQSKIKTFEDTGYRNMDVVKEGLTKPTQLSLDEIFKGK